MENKNKEEVIMEIRAGTGGEEASVFAKDLFEMYSRFADRKGWKVKLLDYKTSDIGGLKEASLRIKGEGAKDLMIERGVHRVQRVPKTEKKGRIHTSTATVAVLEKPSESEVQINPQDLRIETCRASGPGGQHVNRRETAVKITHLPTGITATSQSSKGQRANRENALSVLRARVYQAKKEEEDEKIKEERKSQIGAGERSEKTRTYNFPQDRITDHRIKKSWQDIEKVLKGEMDKILKQTKKKMGKS